MYRGLPALWDVKCKDYSKHGKKGKQYDVLIEKYREKYPDAEKQEVLIFITYFSNDIPLTSTVFFPVGLSSLTRHFQLL